MRGIAIFHAKADSNTIPKDADPGRYLGGIIRNLDDSIELRNTAKHLLQIRQRHQDIALAPLHVSLDNLRSQFLPMELPSQILTRALQADPCIDFLFYSSAFDAELAKLGPEQVGSLYAHFIRLVTASFSTDKQRRIDLIASITAASIRTTA